MGYKDRMKRERKKDGFSPRGFTSNYSGDFSGGGGGGGGYADRKMYDVKCSECGQATQVPFEPKEGRPVYCKECYRKKKPF